MSNYNNVLSWNIPEDLSARHFLDMVMVVDKVYSILLFDTDPKGMDPVAEQHYLLALTQLEQAKANLTLANLYQTKEEAK